jgi:NitT/TauT family transport system substrate-binding protein
MFAANFGTSWVKLLAYARAGDTIVVWPLDRLSLKEVMMRRISLGLQWFMVLLVLVMVVGCSSAASPSPSAPALVHVDVALDWVHDVDYAGFYLAQDQGLYAAANLDVGILPFSSTSSLDMVLQGKAAFGISSADVLLQQRAQGKPVVAIATVYQRNPLGFAALAESNIVRPQDLVGKRVSLDPTGTSPFMLQAMLASQGLDKSQVTIIPRTDFTNDALIKHEVDVIDVYFHNQPVELEQMGYTVTTVLAADYGIEVYAVTLFTTEEMIRTQPDVIQGLVTATIRGYQAVVKDPAAAITHVLRRDPELNADIKTKSLERAVQLMNPRQPGMMTDEGWQGAYQTLQSQGVISQTVEVSHTYTLRFLEEAYRP